MDAAFCTIIAKNYLAYARVLARSLRAHHRDVPFYVLVVDEPAGFFDPGAEPFTVLGLEALDLPRPREFCFRYSVLELSTAVKPYLLRTLFARGHSKLVFLDPDIAVYRPLDCLLRLLGDWQVILTPHLTDPVDDEKHPSERDILLTGAYNLGFVALARGPDVDRLVDWWAERCETQCVVAKEKGLFVDQRWIDLVPGLLDRVHILRHSGFNVAYWNLSQRPLTGRAEAPLVQGQPLHFFHFSGLDPLKPMNLSHFQDRHTRVVAEPLRSIIYSYSAELLAAGYQECARWPYTHGVFRDGHPVTPELRELFREQPPGRFPDPFQSEETDSFLRWAITPRATGLSALVARLWEENPHLPTDGRPGWIDRLVRRVRGGNGAGVAGRQPCPDGLAPVAGRVLAARPDVRKAFATPDGRLDRVQFLRWLSHEGVTRYGLKPAWCSHWLGEADAASAMSRLLAAYGARPELQRRFPMAFVEEHDAPRFLGWLEENGGDLGFDQTTLMELRRTFAAEPTLRIAEILDRRPDVAQAFPQALAWPGDPAFLAWLRYSGRREYGVPEDWVLWFARSREQHVCRRLHHLYRTRPAWPERHPLAFSPLGRRRFLAWLKESAEADLGFDPAILDGVCPPHATEPVDDVRILHRTEAVLRDRFPLAFRDEKDTEGLLAWVRARREELGLSPEWTEKLARSLRELGMIGQGATVIGYLRTESGVGELGRATCRALAAVGYPIATVILDDPGKRQADLSVGDREPAGRLPFTILNANAPEAVRRRSSLQPWLEDRFVIGYWAWELETTPADWVRAFPMFDEVWTCSRFAAAALGAVSPVPVQAVWPALSDEAPAPISRPALGLDPDAFIFLFMYDLFSETDRKNPLGLIQAFREAFRRDDKVQLAIKLANANHRRDDLARVVAAAEGLPVKILDRYLSRAEVLGLIETCDAYASLHRAEGFGFTLAESMALAKPVIATHYSGNVDFMTPWNSFPVPYRMAHVPEDRGPYRKGSPWAEPDVGAAAALMRDVFAKPDLAREVARRGQSDVLRLLSPRACGRRITERLAVLAARGVRNRERAGRDEVRS